MADHHVPLNAPDPEETASGYVASADGTRIHYRRRGKGPPLVILNNFFMTAAHWEPFTRRLCKYFEVINYDLRHQGQSDRIEGDIDIADHVADLRALPEGLGLERVVLLGTCISTIICRDFALESPERVDSMVLVGPIFGPFGSLFRTFLHRSLLASLAANGAAGLFDHYYPLLYTARTIENSRAVGYLALKTRFIENNPPEQLHRHLSSTVRLRDDPELLKGIRPRTLLLCGEEDFLTSPHALAVTCKIMPDARYELIEMAGHNPYVEAPAEFQRRTLAFLLPGYPEFAPPTAAVAE